MKLATLQYGIPLTGFIAGIFLFYFLNPSMGGVPHELIAFGGGLSGLSVGAVISHKLAGRIAAASSAVFEIARIL